MSAIDYSKLAAPLHPDDLEWRVGQHSAKGDRCTLLVYLTARGVMDRLDKVCGPAGWRASYTQIQIGKESGFLCTLELLTENGWIAKQDAADVTDIEQIKGGVSSALKRAAVQWGIGRYLYAVPKTGFLKIEDGYPKDDRSIFAQIGTKQERADGNGKPGHVFTPRLPDFALPEELRHKTDKGKETDDAKAARQSEHHESWEANKARFFAESAALGFKYYDELCEWMEALKKPRPSVMDQQQRTNLLTWLSTPAAATKYAEFLQSREVP